MILVYMLVVLPWHVFCLWSSGSLLPNTFHANFRGLATRIYPPGYLRIYASWLFFRDHPWIYWLVPLGVLATLLETWRQRAGNDREAWLPPFGLALAQISSLWALCYPIASNALLPIARHHARYTIPMTPFHAILCVVALQVVLKATLSKVALRRSDEAEESVLAGWRGVLRRVRLSGDTGGAAGAPTWKGVLRRVGTWWAVLILACVLSALPALERWAEVYGRNLFTINHQHVAMARWIAANTPAEAVVATHDVGALGAVGQRRILDLFGLVSPDMIQRTAFLIPTDDPRLGSWYLQQLDRHGATFLVGYPGWLPFIHMAPDSFEEVHRVKLEQADIAGSDVLVAHRVQHLEGGAPSHPFAR